MHKPQKKHNEIRGYVKRVFLCPSRHAALSLQKKQGLKKPLLLCFYNVARPQAGIFTIGRIFIVGRHFCFEKITLP